MKDNLRDCRVNPNKDFIMLGAECEDTRSSTAGVVLFPDCGIIRLFLKHLFDDVVSGSIELAWTEPSSRNIFRAIRVPVGELDTFVQMAARINVVAGQNVYVGASVRVPELSLFGRAKCGDFHLATAYWADIDDKIAVEKAKSRILGFPPTIGVVTSSHPFPRWQLWWKMPTPCYNPSAVRRKNLELARTFDGDRHVSHPSHVMRLPGTIAWPKKNQRKIEVTKLIEF